MWNLNRITTWLTCRALNTHNLNLKQLRVIRTNIRVRIRTFQGWAIRTFKKAIISSSCLHRTFNSCSMQITLSSRLRVINRDRWYSNSLNQLWCQILNLWGPIIFLRNLRTCQECPKGTEMKSALSSSLYFWVIDRNWWGTCLRKELVWYFKAMILLNGNIRSGMLTTAWFLCSFRSRWSSFFPVLKRKRIWWRRSRICTYHVLSPSASTSIIFREKICKISQGDIWRTSMTKS